MAKKITKQINSQFRPTIIDGKVYYDMGGMMMPGGMLDMSPYIKQQQGMNIDPSTGQAIDGAGNLIGSAMDSITAANNDKPYAKKSVAGGAISGAAKGGSAGMMLGPWGAVGGAAIGGIAGALGTSMGNKESKMNYADDVLQDRNQQTIANLPGQPSYIPTFADGGEVVNKNKDYSKAWGDFYNAQSVYTDALSNKYPEIPIKDILSNSVKDSTFNNANLDNYSQSLIGKYGDFHLNPNEMDSVSNASGIDINQIQSTLSKYDNSSVNKNADITGTKEQTPERFGSRMMLHRRYDKGNTPYKYLDDSKELATYGNGGSIVDRTTSFDTGGLHSENGGIPMGENAMVERDEYAFTNKQGKKYIFSNKF